MGFKINEIRLRANTESGLFGVSAKFTSGLNVFWADNSMGKSTSIQSIIYALGLEKMLSPQGGIPLPHAMTTYVEEDIGEDTVEHSILSSDVWMELENDSGGIVSIRRSVAGQDNPKLVSVWHCEIEEIEGGNISKRDYFVKDGGSATREAGFHKFLSDFLDLELPLVYKHSGGVSPLYLECLFPLFIVEQKRGWTGIQANLPTYMGLKEVGKRAIEYIAKLDVFREEQERERLNTLVVELRKRWRDEVEIAGLQIESVGGQLTNISDHPPKNNNDLLRPSASFREEGQKIDIQDLRHMLSERLQKLQKNKISDTKTSVKKEELSFNTTQEKLLEKESLYLELNREISMEESLSKSLNKRLLALEEDERKHKDLLKLQKMGAEISLDEQISCCPTCLQQTSSVLYDGRSNRQVMSIEDNVEFIKAQKETFEVMKRTASQSLREKKQIFKGLEIEIAELKAEIRSLKTLLIEDERVPSVVDVRRVVVLEQRIHMLEGVDSRIKDLNDSIENICNEWFKVLNDQSNLNNDGLSSLDKQKIRYIETSYRSQIEQYGLRSVIPNTISISDQNYKPMRDGFNLGFDLSASDNIRSIWAYLLAFLELDKKFETNHLGVLILDEPRQQSTNKVSFSEFLARASVVADGDKQVILATSESFESLSESLNGVKHNLIKYDGRVLKRI